MLLFDELAQEILNKIKEDIKALEDLPVENKIMAINEIKTALHECSPFKNEPVDCVLWVASNNVEANDYNPNAVAPPEMKLLEISIKEDGYTQPVVTFPEEGKYTVIDGYHRTRVAKESKTVRNRILGYIPITIIRPSQCDIKNRIASTIRHNRARGVHGINPMIDIVGKLLRDGWTDEEVSKELGMDADEVLRFKQHVGLPELFKDYEYSRAWE